LTRTQSCQPLLTQQQRRLRADVYRWIRSFFDTRGVLEVQTPVLSGAGNPDPHIESFQLESASAYLRTSPEFPMKRLLAANSGAIYELGPVFRRGEQGQYHNPEFTMLEWYRPGFDHQDLADEVAELIRGLFDRFGTQLQASETVEYRACFLKHTGLDPISADTRELHHFVVKNKGYKGELNRADCLDYIFSQICAPQLNPYGLSLIMNYPAELAALAKLSDTDSRIAERFEVYLGETELANGYHELLDADELQARFIQQNQIRKQNNQQDIVLDQNLLQAQANGMDACAGVAMGVDRVLMLLAGVDHLNQVIDFPWEYA